VFSLGFTIGPVIGVLVWHLVGRAVWWYCALACLVGLAAAWRGMRPAAHEEDAELVAAGVPETPS